MKDDTRVIKSHVWHEGKCFFVSTINRESSAMYGGRFAETIVWEYDWDERKRGQILHQDEAMEDCISTHLRIVKTLNLLGVCKEPEGDHDG